MFRKFLFYLLLSFIILIVTGFFIRSHSRVADIWVTHIVYFIAVFVSIKYSKLPGRYVLVAYLAGGVLPVVIVMILNGLPLLFFLNTISFILAILGGYFIAATTGHIGKKWAFVSLQVVYCVFSVFYLADRFLHYDGYNNFEGNVKEKIEVSGSIFRENDTLQIKNDNRIIVLDFWTTSCGFCFKKFPKLQDIYSQYKNDKRVGIYSVNVPIKRDTGNMATDMIHKRGYIFPVYFASGGIDTQLNVMAYPTVLLIKDNVIIGRGSIENISMILREELQ